ncbi:alpha/beta hydrolase [Nocardioides sp. WS12]|uniref:alpha/beta hydrolase n=1 Tax=Nocardioides sp. WS12 TaxID=2486272 RepID=UPI0015FC47C7|nr:alpha/beta hydrolase [Nocardioides sp. WS12]
MLTPDPQIAEAFAVLVEKFTGAVAAPARGDAPALRAMIDAGLDDAPVPESSGVSVTSHRVPTSDGQSIEMRWYTPDSATGPGPVVVYLHGGGMIAGKPDHVDGLVRHYAEQTGVRFAVPDYRLSPEHPGERMARDAFETLVWVLERSETFSVDPDRAAVMGDSGGGGVAAGTAVLARDLGVPLAKQVLIYPMLDDRNTVPDPDFPPFVSWDWSANWTCWNAVLGGRQGTDHVSPIEAPARLVDVAGLAPAYIEVGELDIFRDESISFAQRLHRAGVSCELHVLPGVTHGHDRLSLEIDVSRRSLVERCRVLRDL